MKSLICAIAFMVPNVALADFDLSYLVGDWTGQGSYAENLSSAKMRCKVAFTGSDQTVTMSGRCASGLGAQKIGMELTRQDDGAIFASATPDAQQNKTEIDGLTGMPEGPHLVLRGAAQEDAVTLEFLMNADGTLRFGVHSVIGEKDAKSVIILTRR